MTTNTGRITQADIKSATDYDPETGEFRRKDGTLLKVRINNCGVATGTICGKARVLHNMVFLYMEGRQPGPHKRPIKHINGDQSDLRYANLVWVENVDGTLGHDELVRQLKYDPCTGVFTWVAPKSVRVSCGDLAGSVRKGYLQIDINGRRYLAHRLAWFYIHKEWPNVFIDHVDRNQLNNKLENLRLATRSQNGQNSKDRASASGFRGVSQTSKNRWRAAVKIDGKTKYLGLYTSPEEAHQAFLRARDEYYTHHKRGTE